MSAADGVEHCWAGVSDTLLTPVRRGSGSGFRLALVWLGTGLGLANASSVEPPIRKAETKAAFTIQVASVRQQMQAGGRYQYVDPTERATVNTKPTEM